MTFKGRVFKHNRNGTRFGYPTANIIIDDKSIDGLFLGYTALISTDDKIVKGAFSGKKLPSIVYIGMPESLGEQDHRLETFILDFPKIDLYGSELAVDTVGKLRDNLKFNSEGELIDQMKKDEAKARKWFSA